MTDADILAEVKRQIATTDDDAVFTWVNSYIDHLAIQYIFPHLHKLENKNTIAATQDYTLADDLAFGKTFWTAERQLAPDNELDLAADDPKWNTTQGTVTRYLLNHNVLSLYHIPDSVFTFFYTYQKLPILVSVTQTTEYLGFPRWWHPLIIQGGVVKGLQGEDNPKLESATVILNKMLKELLPSVYRRTDVRYIMGSRGVNRGMRPAKLPSHFPVGS